MSTEFRSPYSRDPIQIAVLQRAIDRAREEPERPLAAVLFDISDGRVAINPFLDVLWVAPLVDKDSSSFV